MSMTKKIEDGGPAFPLTIVHESDGRTGAPVKCDVFTGLTRRDWFAGQALAGLYANRDLQLATLHDYGKLNNGDFNACMARQAYEQADAMIAASKAGEA